MDSPRTANRTFFAVLLVPAIALPALFGVALLLASGPSRPDPVNEVVDPAELVYETISREVDIPLPGDRGRLRVDLVAVFNDQEEVRIRQKVGPNLIPVTRTITEDSLRLVEDLEARGQLSDDLQALRQALPEVLRASINSELEREGLAPAVLEILISKWAVATGGAPN
ncbi:MAG: hypothetical protein MK180_06965 [Rhodobacteraceae bacterium]|nr:hypothetical protein [Paracoccaceae bacterium]